MILLSIFALFILFFQTDPSAALDSGKGFVLSALSGSPLTTATVALIKRSYPSISSAKVMYCAFGVGIAFSFLLAGAQGTNLTIQAACLCVLSGFLSAVAAMAVRGADNKADEKREEIQGA